LFQGTQCKNATETTGPQEKERRINQRVAHPPTRSCKDWILNEAPPIVNLIIIVNLPPVTAKLRKRDRKKNDIGMEICKVTTNF
jgi:hypothetical protein